MRAIFITVLKAFFVNVAILILMVYVMAWAMQKKVNPEMWGEILSVVVLYGLAGSITYAIVKHRKK